MLQKKVNFTLKLSVTLMRLVFALSQNLTRQYWKFVCNLSWDPSGCDCQYMLEKAYNSGPHKHQQHLSADLYTYCTVLYSTCLGGLDRVGEKMCVPMSQTRHMDRMQHTVQISSHQGAFRTPPTDLTFSNTTLLNLSIISTTSATKH